MAQSSRLEARMFGCIVNYDQPVAQQQDFMKRIIAYNWRNKFAKPLGTRSRHHPYNQPSCLRLGPRYRLGHWRLRLVISGEDDGPAGDGLNESRWSKPMPTRPTSSQWTKRDALRATSSSCRS